MFGASGRMSEPHNRDSTKKRGIDLSGLHQNPSSYRVSYLGLCQRANVVGMVLIDGARVPGVGDDIRDRLMRFPMVKRRCLYHAAKNENPHAFVMRAVMTILARRPVHTVVLEPDSPFVDWLWQESIAFQAVTVEKAKGIFASSARNHAHRPLYNAVLSRYPALHTSKLIRPGRYPFVPFHDRRTTVVLLAAALALAAFHGPIHS